MKYPEHCPDRLEQEPARLKSEQAKLDQRRSCNREDKLIGDQPSGLLCSEIQSGPCLDSDRYPAPGYPSIAGGAPDNQTGMSRQEKDKDDSEEKPETTWPPGRTDLVELNLGLNRDEDLSQDANWLVERLLAGARDYGEELDYLQWRADKDDIDLPAAIDELNAHGLLVGRKAGWIDLPWKAIPRKDSRKQ